MIKTAVFSLLRLGLEISKPDDETLETFARLTGEDWDELYGVSLDHGVAGICFDGLKKAIGKLRETTDTTISKELLIKWYGVTCCREKMNARQLSVAKRLACCFAEEEITFILMKGQANSLYYPKPFHRDTGDIDCFLIKKHGSAYHQGNDIAKAIGLKVDESWYKHSVISFEGETIENHQFFVHTRDGKRGKELDRTLRALIANDVTSYIFYPNTKISLPPVMFNALFLTYHGLAHFVSEGMRLKQITDWVMFLEKEKDNIDWGVLHSMCKKFNLDVFLKCMNIIANKYYGICVSCDKSERLQNLADKIIDSVMNDKDFVFGSGKGNWFNRYHLITNLFKYRWKYKEIYEVSIWRQIWFYFIGFIFKTE